MSEGSAQGKIRVRHYKTTQHIIMQPTTTQQQQQWNITRHSWRHILRFITWILIKLVLSWYPWILRFLRCQVGEILTNETKEPRESLRIQRYSRAVATEESKGKNPTWNWRIRRYNGPPFQGYKSPITQTSRNPFTETSWIPRSNGIYYTIPDSRLPSMRQV